jgi:hypothetical protein
MVTRRTSIAISDDQDQFPGFANIQININGMARSGRVDDWTQKPNRGSVGIFQITFSQTRTPQGFCAPEQKQADRQTQDSTEAKR